MRTQPEAEEKVVSLATLTGVPSDYPLPPLMTATLLAATQQGMESQNAAYPPPPGDTPAPTLPPQPGSTPEPLSRTDVLEGTGLPVGMMADPYAQIQLSFPAGWSISSVEDSVKMEAKEYTTFIDSPPEAYPGGNQMHLMWTVKKDNHDYAKALESRLAYFDKEGINVIATEEWSLESGEPAVVWSLNVRGEPTAELLTVVDGNTIILKATGDLVLFNPIAGSLQRLTASKPGG